MAAPQFSQTVDVPLQVGGYPRSLGRNPEVPRDRANVSLDSALAGLCFVAIPLGGVSVQSGSGTLLLPASDVFILLLIGNLALGTCASRGRRYTNLGRNTKLAVSLLLLMLIPVLVSRLEPRELVAYFSFAMGTFGGIFIGTVWSRSGRTLGFVDLGSATFLIVSSIQLVAKFLTASGVSEFHRVAVLNWGGSNYLAGVMVVVALALAARLIELNARRLLLAVPMLAILVSILTLSRGALIAAAAGLLVLFWNAGRTAFAKIILRTAGVAAALAGIPVLQYLVAARSQGGFDPGENVSDRLHLFQLAWDAFVGSPLTGTGWLGMRDLDPSPDKISFAHNLVVSFLQIAGIFGATFLAILAIESVKGLRRRTIMGAAVVGALVISMSDPFFEGDVGAMVSWAVIMYVSSGISLHPTHRDHERGVP